MAGPFLQSEKHRDGDDVEPGPLLTDGELTMLAKADINPDEPRRQFNFVRFHQMTLILSPVTLLLILAMMLLTVHVGDPRGYQIPRSARDTVHGALLWVINPANSALAFQ